MKKHLSLLSLIALILFSACSKQPYYFTTTPVASSYKQIPTENTATASVQQETIITAESIPAKASTSTKSDLTATASITTTPAVVTPRTAAIEAPVIATERSFTKKEVKLAIKEAKKEIKKATKQDEGGTSGKSQLVALLLAIFVGALGIHRFYLGYTTIGIIQLLTLGGCGIWALIDLIRIITGDLKPANGDYSEKL
ncbi:TM2 domain-containing protein [Pontibacter sp. HSC-14F20]|uniref:TM2 domain-containing protein n=1 Tax=Pontibacter sp. HSC-14F20 TaxID=2864136 RepID=UPI001C73D8D1|nr:TM2 domain-containing protein [Pontibacter sp. HSC-14F20]MBX0335103.1 TM2 domain-containing protein [Pontibacter sp. HSC-14F20]